MFLVVMGVCGSGKTTVGEQLAAELSWHFADADDYHPESNKLKMAQSVPLTDEDRLPWLLALHNLMKSWYENQANGVITCSALKKSYRHILNHGVGSLNNQNTPSDFTSNGQDENAAIQGHVGNCTGPLDITFVYLKGSYELISSRMKSRTDHFMPQELLKSQLDTLQEPGEDEKHIVVDIDTTSCSIIQDIKERLNISDLLHIKALSS